MSCALVGMQAQEYPTHMGGNISGTGEFACPEMPDYSYVISGDFVTGLDTQVPSDDPQVVENNAAFDNIFGAATFQESIEVEVEGYGSGDGVDGAGDPISKTVETTLTFDTPTPPGELGFIIADVEQDQVMICATDASGAPVPNSVINTWFQYTFDAETSDGDSSAPPTWDAANATLVGHLSPSGVKQTVYVNQLGDDEAGAAAFIVTTSIKTLTFKSQAIGVAPDDPSQHFILASTCVEPTCAELAADPVAICAYIEGNPASNIASADCDNGGISNLIECETGNDPSDPADDCMAAEDAAIDICPIVLADPNGALAQADCDNGGVINLIECQDGGDPFDPADDSNPCEAPGCNPVPTGTVCSDGSDSVTLVCDANLSNVIWYNGLGDAVGNGCSITITNADVMNGAVGDQMCFYYEGTDANGCPGETCCPVIIEVIACQIDLELDKAILAPLPTAIGDPVTFAIVIENQGPATATGVVVTDYLPSCIDYVGNNGGAILSGGSLIWNVGTLAPNASMTLQISGTVNSSGMCMNAAEVTGHNEDDVDSQPNNDDGDQSEDDEDKVAYSIDPVIDVELDKAIVGPVPTAIGDQVTFEISVINKGPDIATGVEVTDYLPSCLTYVSNNGASQGSVALNGSNVIWAVGTLPVNGTATVQITATVNSSGTCENVAEVTAHNETDIDSDPNNDDGDQSEDEEDNEILNIDPLIDVELDKSIIGAAPTTIGGTVTFSVSVVNQGPDVATNVQVTDYLPACLDYVSNTPSVGSSTLSGSSIIWTVGTLAVGQTENILITATVNSSGVCENVAEVTGHTEDDIDSDPNNDDGDQSEDEEDNEVLNIDPLIDVELTKSLVGAAPTAIGDQVVFQIDVVNLGPDAATGVQVTDYIPSCLTYVSNNAGAGFSGGNVIWNIGNLAVNQTISMQITATVNSSGTCENVAEVTGHNEDDIDSDPNNDDGDQSEDEEDNEVISIDPLIDVELTKSLVSPAPQAIGDPVVFQVNVVNLGPDVATGVVVTDYLPSCLTYVSNDGGASLSGSNLVWNVGTLAVGQTQSLQISTTINQSGTCVNVAEVTAHNEDDVDSVPNNDDGDQSEDEEDNEAVSVDPVIDVELDKSIVGAVPTAIGDPITYQVNVINLGPDVATNVEVTDYIPSCITYTSNDQGALLSGGNLVWNVGTLAVNGTASIQIMGVVNSSGTCENVAEVTGHTEDDIDSDPNNDDGDQSEDEEDNEVFTIDPLIDVQLTKELFGPAPTNIGDQVQFLITVSNLGPDVATNVEVTDPTPACLNYVGNNGGAVYTAPDLVWDAGTLTVNGTKTLLVTYTVAAGGDCVNVAEITGHTEDDIDSVPGNGADNDGDGDIGPIDQDGSVDPDDEDDGDDEPINIPVIDVELIKTLVAPAPTTVNDPVTFEVSVTNQGPDAASGVEVTDYLPTCLTYSSDVPSKGVSVLSGSNIIWTVGNLAVGETATLTVTGLINTVGLCTNIAEVTDHNEDDIDSTPGNGADTDGDGDIGPLDPDGSQDPDDEDEGDDESVIVEAPGIEIVKSAPDGTDIQVIDAGGTATFDITVTNTGSITLTNITVTDPLAPDCDNSAIPDLAPQQSFTYTCTLAGVSADFTNKASVTGDPTNGGPQVMDMDPTDVVVCPVIDPGVVTYGSLESCVITGVDGDSIFVFPPVGQVLPAGYSLKYVLVSNGTIIEDISLIPAFEVTEVGTYAVHLMACDGSLDYSGLIFGTSTVTDLLDAIEAQKVCATLNLTAPTIETEECCIAEAGFMPSADVMGCVGGGSTATITGSPMNTFVPTGYVVEYLLVLNNAIIDINPTAPIFNVAATGNYSVHAIVYDPATYNLSGITLGVTTRFELFGDIQILGICADFDLFGTSVAIDPCCVDFLYVPGVGIPVPPGEYEANIEVTSDGLVNAGPTEYHAGDSVELLPGFEVTLGTEFEAYIEGCN